jgi:hypothetical protein
MIGSWPSIERIVVIPTIKEIIAITAIENIIALFAVEGIVSPSTVETVVPSSTVDLVISIIAGDPVSTVLTVNIVTAKTKTVYVPEATFTINVIVPISPKDAVRFIFCPRTWVVARSWSTVSEDPVITGISIDLVTSSAALKDVCTRGSIHRFITNVIVVRTCFDSRKSPEDQREHNRDERKKHPKIAASCSHHRSLLS